MVMLIRDRRYFIFLLFVEKAIYISNLLGVLYFESSALSRFLLYQYETELARLSTGVMETETGTTFKIQHF